MISNAATVYWLGTTNNNWNTATNWSSGAVPGSGDHISFTTNANVLVDIPDTTLTISEIEVLSGANVTIDINGKNLTLTSNAAYNSLSAAIICVGYLKFTNSTTTFGQVEYKNMRVEPTGVFTIDPYVSVNQTNGTTYLMSKSNYNILTGLGGLVNINNLVIEDLISASFAGNTNVSMRDLKFNSIHNVVEFPSVRTTTFSTVQNWSTSGCGVRNEVRSSIGGSNATINFASGSNVGSFFEYENISRAGGGFTANNSNVLNCSGITGTFGSASNISAIKTGDWNDPTTWSNSCVPTHLDSVVVNNNYQVRITSYYFARARSLNIHGGGKVYSQNDSGRLEIHGSLVANAKNVFNTGSNKLTCPLEIRAPGTARISSGDDTLNLFGPLYSTHENSSVYQNCHIKIFPSLGSRGDFIMERGFWRVNGAKNIWLTAKFSENAPANFKCSTGIVEVISQAGVNAYLEMLGTGNLYNLRINQANKFCNTYALSNIKLANDVKFIAGVVFTTPSARLIIWDNAVVSQISANSFVEGPVEKIGNDAFVFPVGGRNTSGLYYAPMTITAPAAITDAFIGRYYLQIHNNYSSIKAPDSLVYISEFEYWTLDRSSGTSNVKVTLAWDKLRSGDLTKFSVVRVAHYDGADWHSTGYGSINSSGATGTVTSPTWSSFSPFTFGDIAGVTGLPVHFISFTGRDNECLGTLEWEMGDDEDVNYCTVQKFIEGEWCDIKIQNREVTIWSTTVELDNKENIFRIGAHLFNGNVIFSDHLSILCKENEPELIHNAERVALNNLNTQITSHVTLYDLAGKLLWTEKLNNQSKVEVPRRFLNTGVCILQLREGSRVYSYKVL